MRAKNNVKARAKRVPKLARPRQSRGQSQSFNNLLERSSNFSVNCQPLDSLRSARLLRRGTPPAFAKASAGRPPAAPPLFFARAIFGLLRKPFKYFMGRAYAVLESMLAYMARTLSGFPPSNIFLQPQSKLHRLFLVQLFYLQ